MKIAIIDYKNEKFGKNVGLGAYLKLRGIDAEVYVSLDELQASHDLEEYGGMLMHPSMKEWGRCLRLSQEHPNLKYAIVTHGLTDFLERRDLRVFDFEDDREEIANYFLGR